MMKMSVSSPSKLLRFVLAGIFLSIALACTVFGINPEPTPEPETFEYCGARLTELCVVFFGRDAFGDTVVNLFVPRMRYPAFYLDIVRRTGGGRYECLWNKDVETSAYCTGNPLNLGEGIEIQMRAKLDDRLLARGVFTVTAFLVTTPVVEKEGEDDGPDSLLNGTNTPTPENSPTPTETPSSELTLNPASTNTSTNDATFTPTSTPNSSNLP